MYIAGHILSSIILAKVAHKPLRVGFFPLAIAAMAVNLIDADHLVHYYRDTGVGNSFLLHPLHQTWAFMGLAVCLLALVLKSWQNLILGVLFALVLHYGLDLLSNVVAYNLAVILGFEMLCLAVLIPLFWKEVQRWKYVLFFAGIWLISNGILGYITMVLHWQPHETRGVYLTAVILNIVAVAGFWVLFRESAKPKDIIN